MVGDGLGVGVGLGVGDGVMSGVGVGVGTGVADGVGVTKRTFGVLVALEQPASAAPSTSMAISPSDAERAALRSRDRRAGEWACIIYSSRVVGPQGSAKPPGSTC